MPANWELIDHNADQGVRTFMGSGEADDTVLVRREFDAPTALLDRNKALQNEAFDRKSEMWHAASIPISVMYEWLTKFGVNAWNPAHSDGVKKLLNSSEYRWCKVKHIIL